MDKDCLGLPWFGQNPTSVAMQLALTECYWASTIGHDVARLWHMLGLMRLGHMHAGVGTGHAVGSSCLSTEVAPICAPELCYLYARCGASYWEC